MLLSIIDVVAAITNILKETRSEILSCLKSKGHLSVEEIASEVGVSKVSIRRHLDLLSRDGLVAFEVRRHERGRPSHSYFLTDKAEMLFPTGYNTFVITLLGQVETQFGRRAVSTLFCGQANDLISTLKPELEGLEFNARVRKLCKLVNERGYDIALRRLKDGSYLVKQRNCPMIAVAVAYDQVCDQELRLYRELLGTEVVRECRIAGGAQSCDYRIMPPARKAASAAKSTTDC